MTLDATARTRLIALHGETYLIGVTNPEATSTPSAIDYDVLEVAVEAAEAVFSRRGYSLTRENVELLRWVDLFARPENLWGERESKKMERLEREYPPSIPGASAAYTNGVAEGDADDLRAFGRDQLDALDPSSSRTIRPHPRGAL